jgi:hypothetical protein
MVHHRLNGNSVHFFATKNVSRNVSVSRLRDCYCDSIQCVAAATHPKNGMRAARDGEKLSASFRSRETIPVRVFADADGGIRGRPGILSCMLIVLIVW